MPERFGTYGESASPVKKAGPSCWAVFLLFIPIIRNTVLIRQRADASDYTGIDIYAMIDIAAFLISCYVMISHWHEIPWRKIRGSSFLWWIVYYVFCLFSIFWRLPGSSIPYICYRASAMLVMSLYTVWLLNQFRDRVYAFQCILKYIFMIGFLGVLEAIKSGWNFHTNSYSVSFAVVATMLLALKGNIDGKKYKTVLIASIFCLFLGTSSGSNVAFACGVLLLLSNSSKKLSPPLVILAIIIGYFLYAYALEYIVEYLMPGKTMDGVESMTGRSKIWESYIEAWKLQPWLGYGFAVGEKAGASFGYIYCLSAHNGFISLLINTGIVGIFIFGNFFFRFMISLYQKVQQQIMFAYPIFFAMIVIIINNMTVPIIGSQWGTLAQTALFLIVFDLLFLNKQESDIHKTGIILGR